MNKFSFAIILYVMSAWMSAGIVCAQDNDAKYKAMEYFLEAQRVGYQGKYDAAGELYYHSYMLDPDNAATLYELSNYSHYLKNDSLSLVYLRRAVKLSPDNYWYQDALVRLYVSLGRVDDAISVLEHLSEKYPEKEDVLMMLESLYTDKQDYANVIKTLDKLELKEGKSEQLSMEKFRVYAQMKDEKNAFREMSELAAEYPNDLRYKVLIGDLYLDSGKTKEAYDMYKAVEAEDSTNIHMLYSLATYYETIGDDAAYQKHIERMLGNAELDDDVRTRLIGALVYQNVQSGEDTTKMLQYFDKVLSLPQKDDKVLELCARYMVTKGVSPDRVKPVLYSMLQLDPENDLARSQLLQYAVEDNDNAALEKVCKPAVDYNAPNPVYYYFLGYSYFMQDRKQEAITVLRQCSEKFSAEANLSLVTNVYTLLGDLYHDVGEDAKCYEAYDSCLLYRPDDALVLNNYAYYLSLQRKQLDRAEEMSRRSNELDPGNTNNLDTYAWVLFQQKKYDEAKVYIDSVLVLLGDSVSGSDSNFFEHAGDIYAKLGRMDEAVSYWERAVSLGSTNAILEQKIRKRKYLAK